MKNAYVCVLSTNDYLDGVLVLNENLKALNSKYELICLINENINIESRKTLKEFNIITKEVPHIKYEFVYDAFNYWSNTFDKLNLFDLTEYEKIVYLDLDLLILKNIDHLFLEQAISMPLDLPFNLKKYNSGIMVIEPNHNDYVKLMKVLKKFESKKLKISDQNIINEYFKKINPLPYGYNMVRSILYEQSYILNDINYEFIKKNQVSLFLKDSSSSKIIHYTGKLKPFMMENPYDDQYCYLYFYYLSLVKEKKLKIKRDSKLVSIIVPVYNKEKYLEKCIESILNQTYRKLELILVNDGSTDKSLKICKNYQKQDNRIKIINFNSNKGVSFARNQGLKAVTGDYIGFVDADDTIRSDMLEMQLNDIVRYGADIVQCGAIINGKNETLNDRIQFYQGNQYIMKTLLNNWIITPYVWDKLFDKNLISEIKFNEKFEKNEDQLFVYQAIKNSDKFITNNLPLYNYTYAKKDSLTNKFSFKTDKCKLIYLEELKEYINTYYPILSLDLNNYLGYQYYGILYGILNSNIISQELSDVKIFMSIVSVYNQECQNTLADGFIKEMQNMIDQINIKIKIEDKKLKIAIQKKENSKLKKIKNSKLKKDGVK